jgi:hypothetical protein
LKLESFRDLIKKHECDCGESLRHSDIEHYDHPAGWNVKGFQKPQWLYLTCSKCGYQWALWKLGVPRETILPNGLKVISSHVGTKPKEDELPF